MQQSPTIAARLTVKGSEKVAEEFRKVRREGESTFGRLRQSADRMTASTNNAARMAATTAASTANVAKNGLGIIGGALAGLAKIATFVIATVGKIALTAVKAAGVVAVASAGAVALVQRWTLGNAAATEEILKQANAVGISVESLSKWQAAVRLAGGNSENLGEAFVTIRDRMLEVRKGVEGADDSFLQLGVRVRKENGAFKTTEELFGESLEQLLKIGDQGRRAAAAYDVFGSSAADIIPMLDRGSEGFADLIKEAGEYGTVLTTEQAETTRKLLTNQRRLQEALKGAGIRLGEVLLPFFTDAAGGLANWLVDNRLAIDTWLDEFKESLVTVRDDLVALASGKGAAIELGWIRAMVGPFEAVKAVILDIGDLLQGKGLGSRSKWLTAAAESMDALWRLALALGIALLGISGLEFANINDAASAFEWLTSLFDSFRAGIEGTVAEMPWAASLSRATLGLAEVFAGLAGLVIEHRDTILTFANGALTLLADALEAVGALLRGDAIAGSNPFEFLNHFKAFFDENWPTIVKQVESFWKVFKSGMHLVKEVIGWMEALGKAVGLETWQQLGILLLVSQLGEALEVAGGLFDVLGKIGSVVSALDALAVAFFTWVPTAITAMATFFGISFGAMALIVGGLFIALGLAIFFFWDEIVWAAGEALKGIKWFVVETFTAVSEGIVAAYELLIGLADWLLETSVAGARGVQAAWNGTGEFFQNLGSDIWGGWNKLMTDMYNSPGWVAGGVQKAFGQIGDDIGRTAQEAKDWFLGFFDWLYNAPGRAVQSFKTEFAKIGDYLRGPLEEAKKMFDDFINGIGRGIGDTFNNIGNFLTGGGGGQQPAGSPPSFDVGTARVPGADGEPMLATIHGGERILTVDENRRFGAFIESLAAMTTLPQTDFASGPTAYPDSGSGGGSTLQSASFDLNGRKVAGFQAPPSAIRQMQTALRRGARAAAAPAPRWIRA